MKSINKQFNHITKELHYHITSINCQYLSISILENITFLGSPKHFLYQCKIAIAGSLQKVLYVTEQNYFNNLKFFLFDCYIHKNHILLARNRFRK